MAMTSLNLPKFQAVFRMLLAWGRNADGRNVASGCTDGVMIEGGVVTTVDVDLIDELLSSRGSFS